MAGSSIKEKITHQSRLWVRMHNHSKTLLKGQDLSEAMELLETPEAKFLLKNEVDFIKASSRNATKKRVLTTFVVLSVLSGGVYYMINKPPQSVAIKKIEEPKIEKIVEKPKEILDQNSSIVKVEKEPQPLKDSKSITQAKEEKVEEKIEEKIEVVEVEKPTEPIIEHTVVPSANLENSPLAQKFILANEISKSEVAENDKKIIFNALYNLSLKSIFTHSLKKNNGMILSRNRFLTFGENGTVIVWDSKNKTKLHTIKQKGIKSFKLSPNKNYLAIIDRNKKLNVLDLKKGKRILTLKSSPVKDFIFSPNSRKIFVWSKKKTLAVWRLSKLKQLATFKSKNEIKGIDLNSDASRLLIHNSKNEIILIAMEWKKKRVRLTIQNENKILGATFSKRGDRILAFSNKDITVWSAKKEKKILTIEGDIATAKYSKNGTKIVATTKNNELKIWDYQGKEILTINADSPIHKIQCINNSTKFLFYTDKKAIVYDMEKKQNILVIENENNHFFKTNNRLLASGHDERIEFFDIHSGEKLFNIYHQNSVTGVDFRGDKIITFDNKDTRLWQKSSSNNIMNFKINSKNDFYLSNDAKKVISKTKKFFLLHYHYNVKKPNWFKHTGVKGAAFSQDDNKILSYNNNQMIVWNRAKKIKISTINTGKGSLQKALFVSDDVIVVVKNSYISFWNIKDKKRIINMKHLPTISDIQVTPKSIAIMDKKNITIIDVESKKRIKLTHTEANKIYFSKDGEKLFTADSSNIKIWNVKDGTKTSEIKLPAQNLRSDSLGKLFVGFDKNIVSLYDSNGKVILSYAHKDDVIEAKFNIDENAIISYTKGAKVKKTILFNQSTKKENYPIKVQMQSGTKFENDKIKSLSSDDWTGLKLN